ncbi:FxDxF family PEP-CTERM protein [Amantichitinum ursilacus]|uniref:PEP-CTERM motif protein n=1 Tax=Amantichitinum ursilacus TaxID=857265 RepID=A0A0N0GQL7_9NEIS|nr:FxDxF family PEP-CTERM protein [Amantichitinum ursilacus]KPC54803.1 PEP-CTERM motif protein [Amantichitinum ursilacus]
MRSIKFLAVAAASAFVALSAQAANYDLGTLGDSDASFKQVSVTGAFDDILNFSLSETLSDVGSSASSTNLKAKVGFSYNIVDATVSLFKAGSTTAIGSYSFDGTTGDNTNWFNGLAAGDYFYEVTGTATGKSGGLYTLTTNAFASNVTAPVPEPETYALMGLGLVALVAARKKKRA